MKTALFMFAFLGLAACSKSEPDPLPLGPGVGASSSGGGGGSVEPTSEQDTCIRRCDAQNAAATAAFEALDACMEANCKPADEDESDTPPAAAACAPVDAKSISYHHASADACMARVCCAQATACAGDANCLTLDRCYDQCNAAKTSP